MSNLDQIEVQPPYELLEYCVAILNHEISSQDLFTKILFGLGFISPTTIYNRKIKQIEKMERELELKIRAIATEENYQITESSTFENLKKLVDSRLKNLEKKLSESDQIKQSLDLQGTYDMNKTLAHHLKLRSILLRNKCRLQEKIKYSEEQAEYNRLLRFRL